MWYMILAYDRPHSLDHRLKHRAAHLARLKSLQELGRLLLAGPLPSIDSPDPGPAGFDGSLMIVEFTSIQEAEHWASQDPFMTGGVYQSVTVKPFRKTLP